MPQGARGSARADRGLPAGGTPFPTPVGVFPPQNLTPDAETGLGRWSEVDFVNAMRLGVSPRGTHYFPAFPYASYRSMTMPDLLDLRAYLMSLPAVTSPSREAEVPMVALARRGVGLWKRVAFRQPTFSPEPGRTPSWTRGAYLANAPGHCARVPHAERLPDGRRPRPAHGRRPAPRAAEGKVPGLRGLVARKKYDDWTTSSSPSRTARPSAYQDLSSGGMAAIQESLRRGSPRRSSAPSRSTCSAWSSPVLLTGSRAGA